jgi:hypothetical protein
LLLPLPEVVLQQPIKHNRKRGKTAIITSSPYMNELKNCQTPRHVKPPKQVKKYLFKDEAATKSYFKKNVKHRQKVLKRKPLPVHRHQKAMTQMIFAKKRIILMLFVKTMSPLKKFA